jgi:hypothetical protein
MAKKDFSDISEEIDALVPIAKDNLRSLLTSDETSDKLKADLSFKVLTSKGLLEDKPTMVQNNYNLSVPFQEQLLSTLNGMRLMFNLPEEINVTPSLPQETQDELS